MVFVFGKNKMCFFLFGMNDIFEGPICLVLYKSSNFGSKPSTDPGSDRKFSAGSNSTV
jgi:hypothetical protein